VQPGQDRAKKWSGAVRVEMELLLVEAHTEITNKLIKGDDFGAEGRHQDEQRQFGKCVQ
jgi:hypothetical protein